MSFIECNCDQDGSLDGNCNDAGKCFCKTGFDGDKCETCAKDFFGFPQCQGNYFFLFFQRIMSFFPSIYFMSFVECNCYPNGSEDGNCNDAGKCSCWDVFEGDKCDMCAKEFFGFPKCQGIHFFFNLFALTSSFWGALPPLLICT